MHANRKLRAANNTRRKLAAAKQAPLPPDEQRKRAAENQAHKEAKWAKAGYLTVNYESREPARKPPRTDGPEAVFGDLMDLALLTLAANRHGRRAAQRRMHNAA